MRKKFGVEAGDFMDYYTAYVDGEWFLCAKRHELTERPRWRIRKQYTKFYLMKNLKERKKIRIPKNKASKKMLYFFLSLSELKKYLSLSKLKKIFGGKIGQRKPFVTFCNFLFPNCTPGLYIKSIAGFSPLAYCGQSPHPQQIAQNTPLQTLAFCAILPLAFCGISARMIDTRGTKNLGRKPQKQPKKNTKIFQERAWQIKTYRL